MTCAGCQRARTKLRGIVGAAIQHVIPREGKKMQAVEYRILFYDGRETRGTVQLPDPHTEWSPTPSKASKERWRLVREIITDVIGGDADPEHVTVWANDQYLDMFVDEQGVNKKLPMNNIATTIYRANYLAHEPDPGPADQLPYIAGNAVLFLEKVWT